MSISLFHTVQELDDELYMELRYNIGTQRRVLCRF